MRRSDMVHKDAIAGERLLGILCLAVLGVILSLGLWPFHVPANDVAWLGKRNGLRLGSDSTVISAGAFQAEGRGPGSGSLEIWLQPARVWVSSTFLAFSGTDGGEPFRMRQSSGGPGTLDRRHGEALCGRDLPATETAIHHGDFGCRGHGGVRRWRCRQSGTGIPALRHRFRRPPDFR